MNEVYTSRISRIIVALSAIALIGAACVTVYLRWSVIRYDDFIEQASETYGVDHKIIAAVIHRESRFRARAVGKAGERGLMQVTTPAAREWAVTTGRDSFVKAELFDPEINIQAGTWYLARAIQRWSNKPDPLPYALAEYNAGRSNAIRWAAEDKDDPSLFREAITYPSTRRYIADILKRYHETSEAEANCISCNLR